MTVAHLEGFLMLIFSLVVFGFALYQSMILGKLPRLRRLPGVEALDEGIKRAVELGKGVFLGAPMTGTRDPSTLLTVSIMGDLARRVAKNTVKGIYATGSSEFLSLMTGVVRDGYTLEGKVEDFENPQMCKVMALLGGSSGFSTGLFNLIRDENIGTCFLLGYQYINMHAMGEMCKAAGVYSVVGHPNVHVNLPLCITSFDYAILINEYYAVGAFLGKDPVQLGSVRGMDIITYGTALALIITPLLYLFAG